MIDLLAIAAHPDDVEQTCGGTLLRMAEAGYRTGIIDLTAGDMGTRGTPDTRVSESQDAAKILRVSHRENLHFPDARLENTLAARMTLAQRIREMRPRTDHYRASEIGYEACFLAGLRKINHYTEPHRPYKIVYSSIYANVTPSFVVDVTQFFDRRMESLLAYRSQYGAVDDTDAGSALFPDEQEIRERLGAMARFYGNLIGVKYGEPYVVRETMRVDDVVAFPVRSI
jgi:bacillithiol biosynthesis deacetylase BshB1